MIEKTAFQAGMHALGAAFTRDLPDDVLRVFDQVLSSKLDDAQWQKAVRLAIEKEIYFPPPAVLLKYGSTDRPVLTEGAEVFDKILNDFVNGEHLSHREVLARYGIAARDAYAASGGEMAFNHAGTEETAKWVRKAFLATWKDVVEADPQLALPGPANQLPAGEAYDMKELARMTRGATKKMP